MNNLFFELTTVLILAGLVSFLVSLLKQPSIIAYILTGVVVGPLGYYRLQQGDVFSALAEIGITLLLFMVGLQLDVAQLRRLGKTVLFVALGQIVFTTGIGYLILRLLGLGTIPSLYLAPALTFSSTIIVVKLLGEKKDMQSLYGKLVIGIFLTQDFVAILILIALSSMGSSSSGFYSNLPLWQTVIMALVRGLILVLVVWWLSAKVFPKILQHIGNNDELMLVFSLAWALGLASFVSLPIVGFSLEIGGFLAGLSLARSGVHYEISGKIKPIRDFFIILFFIVLGSGLMLDNLSALTGPAIWLSLFVLIGNPLIVMVLLGLAGYKPRTGFLAGVTVAQVSEFSLILVTSGYQLGHLQKQDVALMTLIAIVTIGLSSYMIMYATQIFEKLKFVFKYFDFRKGSAEKHVSTAVLKNHIILVGAHRLGHHLIDALKKHKTPFVIVDFNPEVVEHYIELGHLAVCGDITDGFIQEQVNLPFAKLIISTVPDFNDNLSLIHSIKAATAGKRNHPKLIFIAQDEAETKILYEHGIDYVISPHFMGGLHLAKILEGRELSTGLKKLREHHLGMISNS
ncbi:MAG: cation:proton antiporter [Candidatus Doudnabacteria bacterium]|nr:cation:proton antiporter [Candidatus Doudnabacteria bacterium]